MSYATRILAASTAHYRSGQSDTSALDMAAVAVEIAAAIEFLESLQRGAKFHFGSDAPAVGLGLPGDAYFNRATSDFYEQDASGWVLMGNLKGKDGKTPQHNIDYFDGRTPQLGIDYNNGINGKNAWELYRLAGGQLSLVAWLDSLQGKDGDPGDAGNKNRWESREPGAADVGSVGDAWFYTVSASKVQIWECYQTAAAAAGASQWRVRYTSPDAAAATVVTTPGTNTGPAYSLPQASADILGGIKLGTGLTLNSATGRVDAAASNNSAYSLPQASADTLGGIKLGEGLSLNPITGLVDARKVATPAGAAVLFTQGAEYGPIANGTFTTDGTGARVGVVVFVELGAAGTPPSLDANLFELQAGSFISGKRNQYAFRVAASGKIQYVISQLP